MWQAEREQVTEGHGSPERQKERERDAKTWIERERVKTEGKWSRKRVGKRKERQKFIRERESDGWERKGMVGIKWGEREVWDFLWMFQCG
jgi:hypothetical protein